MARWDNYEPDWVESEEESKLLEKFNQYVDLQREQTKKEKESADKTPKFLKNQNMIIGIIEGVILSGLAVAFAIMVTS
ncbi:MAG: hypothetical protein DWQ18_06515 [Crenarchaeota archaeon]|nr:MAG: hypothetical protein DWQ17_03270 [Thermoproteota archaeon]RDJ32844.1 MAG: hypothetical protein DWQ18_06515 [Thermoproteota archaeon]RDJ38012.1 MAG: hypothetical protein DWQ13_05145 [Thermoproteota archaeon]RDJ38324.1 MAG: hypothetical protein DWQ19_00660 [Thermoproteota archaeon]